MKNPGKPDMVIILDISSLSAHRAAEDLNPVFAVHVCTSVDDFSRSGIDPRELGAVLLSVRSADCQKGLEVCRQLSSVLGDEEIPILFLVESGTEVDPLHALECGAADILQEPMEPALFQTRVQTHVTLRQHREALKGLATRDCLTGLANAGSFFLELERQWRHAIRYNAPISMLLFEVVRQTGDDSSPGKFQMDAAAQDIARLISLEGKRPLDLAARLDAGRFALLLPETEHEGAVHLARLLGEKITQMQSENLGLEVSIGLCSLNPDQGDESADFVDRAESALEKALQQGPGTFASCSG